MDEIKDVTERALSEARALRAARELLVHHRKYTRIADVLELMRRERAT